MVDRRSSQLFGSTQKSHRVNDATVLRPNSLLRHNRIVPLKLNQFNVHDGQVSCAALSPDLQMAVTGSDDGAVRVFDLVLDRLIIDLNHPMTSFEPDEAAVNCVAVSSDSRLIASGHDDHSVCVFETRSARRLFQLKGHKGAVHVLCFSPVLANLTNFTDQTARLLLASGSADHSIVLWCPDKGCKLAQLNGHRFQISALCFSIGCEFLASGSWDCHVALWQLDTILTATNKWRASRTNRREDDANLQHPITVHELIADWPFFQHCNQALLAAAPPPPPPMPPLSASSSPSHSCCPHSPPRARLKLRSGKVQLLDCGQARKLVVPVCYLTCHTVKVQCVAFQQQIQSSSSTTSFEHLLATGGWDAAVFLWLVSVDRGVQLLHTCPNINSQLSVNPTTNSVTRRCGGGGCVQAIHWLPASSVDSSSLLANECAFLIITDSFCIVGRQSTDAASIAGNLGDDVNSRPNNTFAREFQTEQVCEEGELPDLVFACGYSQQNKRILLIGADVFDSSNPIKVILRGEHSRN